MLMNKIEILKFLNALEQNNEVKYFQPEEFKMYHFINKFDNF